MLEAVAVGIRTLDAVKVLLRLCVQSTLILTSVRVRLSFRHFRQANARRGWNRGSSYLPCIPLYFPLESMLETCWCCALYYPMLEAVAVGIRTLAAVKVLLRRSVQRIPISATVRVRFPYLTSESFNARRGCWNCGSSFFPYLLCIPLFFLFEAMLETCWCCAMYYPMLEAVAVGTLAAVIIFP